MGDIEIAATCPACGCGLSQELRSLGLCPGCLMELALESPSLMAEVEGAEDAPTLGLTDFEGGEDAATLGFVDGQPFAEGRVHGGRYRIRSLLGKGGMGEVWRAYDLKLRLDVALKSLRAELVADPQALETLRQEVRTAREVISPNVCRVFDLQELDDQELISMEYVDGTTLQEVLKHRGPLDLNEAREIASQFLAGLDAIHEAGLVHRDIKPENLMITRTGRVVVMDFGIAKALRGGKDGTVAGTPAYMSPEQAGGQELDSRADLFSAGVVLAEMVEPGGVHTFEARKRVWEGIHQAGSGGTEPRLSDTPWAKVVAKAVAPDREARFPSATALARALEEVTLRAAGDEAARPYPGLAAFEREDADYFFGRELEVEALWKKLGRPKLLGVIGPSGAGKSSFLRAGLLAALPETWSVIVATPGNRPFASLAQALARALPNDQATIGSLLRFEEPSTAIPLIANWRREHEHALVLLDQFEELFTLNPPDVQAAFTGLLGKLPLEADAHVLLSMRDDFLIHCQAFESLAPVFSELTPIGAPTGAALRRAIVQPALKCGYRFEDEALVEEMLGEVEGERGSLPMVAFAAARLWDTRDRERGLLTRRAYEQIGGVGGALAQHAEQTLERIGKDNAPIVRELFRNLVTAEGTRAARDRDELLSVFQAGGRRSPGERASWLGEAAEPEGPVRAPAERRVAARVLDTLIDARLLTSYEVPGSEAGESRRARIEIIHESLLSNWPRLVRWQMQDKEGALLRDQLRQAAQAWADRGRPSDLLWSGTSYQEFGLWRQRYPGGLTRAEEEFSRAMTAHAERRRRRRRAVFAGAFALLLAVLAVVFASRQEARSQALRAEANQLLALGRLEIENNTTGALAYALASLERADSPVTRLFALEILWRGPTALIPAGVPGEEFFGQSLDFSPDGRWLASAKYDSLSLWSSAGGAPRVLDDRTAFRTFARYGPAGDFLVSINYGGGNTDYKNDEVHVWSVPEGKLVRAIPSDGQMDYRLAANPARLFTFDKQEASTRVEAWPLAGGEPTRHVDLPPSVYEWSRIDFSWNLDLDSEAIKLVYVPFGANEDWGSSHEFYLVELDETGNTAPRPVGRHEEDIARATFHPDGRHVATADVAGEVRIWDLERESESPVRVLRQPPARWVRNLRFDAAGSQLASATWARFAALWDLEGPPDADPLVLRRGETWWMLDAAFHPDGTWLATTSYEGIAVWPITRRHPLQLKGHEGAVRAVAFLPDGSGLVSGSSDGTLRRWPLSAEAGSGNRVLLSGNAGWLIMIAVDPAGAQLVAANPTGQLWLVPFDDTPARRLTGFDSRPRSLAVSGSLAAAIAEQAGGRVLRVWNLEGDEFQDLEPGPEIYELFFSPDQELISVSADGLGRWNLRDDSFELFAEFPGAIDLTRSTIDWNLNHRLVLVGNQGEQGEAVLYDLAAGTSLQLDSHGPNRCGKLDPGGRFVVTRPCTGRGVLKVGPVSGGPVHLLVGRDPASGFTVSPDGRWIASLAGDDSQTILLWPVPDLAQPPFHTLPYDELLAKLRTLTNLRVVPDPETDTGWSWALDPFPGWEEVPTW